MNTLKYTYNGSSYSYTLKGNNVDADNTSPSLYVTYNGETKHLNLVRDGDRDADGNLKITKDGVSYRIKKWPHVISMEYYEDGELTWAGEWNGRSGYAKQYGLKVRGNLVSDEGNPYNRTIKATPSEISGTDNGYHISDINFHPGGYYGIDNFYGLYGTHYNWGSTKNTIYFNVKYTLDVDNIVCQCTNLYGGYSAE